MRDNRSVTGFFQTEAIPPTLWNACDYILQFNFRITHVAGTLNTAADFLSRLELTSKEKIEFTIREDIQTLPIQTKMQSNYVAEEEQQFFLPDETIETGEKTLTIKQRAKERAQTEAHTQITATIQEANIIPIHKTSFTLGAIKEDARIRNE